MASLTIGKNSPADKVLNNASNLTRKISNFHLGSRISRSIFNGFHQSWSQNLSLSVF